MVNEFIENYRIFIFSFMIVNERVEVFFDASFLGWKVEFVVVKFERCFMNVVT